MISEFADPHKPVVYLEYRYEVLDKPSVPDIKFGRLIDHDIHEESDTDPFLQEVLHQARTDGSSGK